MPVTPYRTALFSDQKDLYQFLLACQTTALAKAQTQIVSISLEVEAVDPLRVLQTLHQADKLHFYLEKGSRGQNQASDQDDVALVAIDPAIQLKVDGYQRFRAAKEFIDSCLAQTVVVGDLQLPFAGPHFFCSFTFFDQGSSSLFPGATIFLPRWQIARQGNQSVLVANLLINVSSNLQKLAEDVWQTMAVIDQCKWNDLSTKKAKKQDLSRNNISKINGFKAAVLSALGSIHQNNFNKIVLAHALDVVALEPFDLFCSLSNLRKFYPNCYVFSIGNDTGQNFIGASPERLIKIRDRELVTDVLAGSAPRGRNTTEDVQLADALLQSRKDLYEHQVVTDFIAQHLSHLGLTPQMSATPHLLQLPNIQHLRTLIESSLPEQLHLFEILAELHPTPAVAGVPREVICQQIPNYESFERDLFAAPLGWVDHQGNGEFIVGIRSALIDGCAARLYAGAGIVAASDPDREVAEIKLKLQVLLEALA